MSAILQILGAIIKAILGAIWERRDADNEAIEIDSSTPDIDDYERL